jgi:hypothetical protein
MGALRHRPAHAPPTADAIDATIGQIDQEADAHVEPFRTAIEILSSISGISDLSTEDRGQLSSGPIPTPPVGHSLRATTAYVP